MSSTDPFLSKNLVPGWIVSRICFWLRPYLGRRVPSYGLFVLLQIRIHKIVCILSLCKTLLFVHQLCSCLCVKLLRWQKLQLTSLSQFWDYILFRQIQTCHFMVVYRNKFTRSVVGWGEVTGKKQFQWRMLKGPGLESSVVHISVTKCHFRLKTCWNSHHLQGGLDICHTNFNST